jgi:hypothetical protein
MKGTCEGVAETVRRVVRQTDDPVITASTPRSLEALAEINPDARLVIDPDARDCAGWATLGRLADAVVDDDAAQLRESDVPNDVVVGREAVASMDYCVSPPTGVIGRPSDSVVERYESLWRAADPLEIDCPTHTAVKNAVTTLASATAASDVDRVCRAVRNDATTDAVSVSVWAAAAATPEYETLREHLPDELDVCERTVRDRIDQLRDAGLVRRRPDPGHGGRGRPPTVVERLADPPLPAPLRGALLR